jgi:hypothetical protein
MMSNNSVATLSSLQSSYSRVFNDKDGSCDGKMILIPKTWSFEISQKSPMNMDSSFEQELCLLSLVKKDTMIINTLDLVVRLMVMWKTIYFNKMRYLYFIETCNNDIDYDFKQVYKLH